MPWLTNGGERSQQHCHGQDHGAYKVLMQYEARIGMRYMLRKINQHDSPCRRIVPNLGGKDRMLLALGGPDARQFDRLPVFLRCRSSPATSRRRR
jgi:hypothetical protein